MTAKRYLGPRSAVYSGTVEDAKILLRYDPATGKMHTVGTYAVQTRVSRHGYNMIRVPISLKHAERGNRKVEDRRADHMAWFLLLGFWPPGWMEHVNGLLQDDSIENLVHLDLNGDRWWYGPEIAGGAPSLVKVETTWQENGYEGPLIYQRADKDGRMRWVPQIVREHRTHLSDGFKEVPVDPDVYEKGEFGLDWGYGTERPHG